MALFLARPYLKSPTKMRFFILLFTILLLSGCSTRTTKSRHATVSKQHTTTTYTSAQDHPINYEDLDKLYPYHNKWHQTPYKFGGFGANGIDCSAFVQRAYFDLFHIQIPRSTKEQVNAGRKVSRNNIRTSDLVFFKTGFSSRHVGIYLQHGDFVHTSSSNGIIISNLNDPYWKKRYWMTRRYK